MPPETVSIPHLDRRDWSELQRAIRSFRAALRRSRRRVAGDRPARGVAGRAGSGRTAWRRSSDWVNSSARPSEVSASYKRLDRR